MTLDDAKTVATIGGTAVALAALIKAVFEYTRQNKQKRAEQYIELREKFKEDGRFDKLFELLENDDPQLADVPYYVKQEFLGFYEDIALLVKSGLLRRAVAHYMFSYYAIRCWESDNFWKTMNRDSVYWRLFKHFVEDMKAVEKKLLKNPRSVRRYGL